MTGRFPHDFQLDGFQQEAIGAYDSGQSVLVAAPTGSGKTVVAEHAIDVTLDGGRRAFYTTPIKALSNQKFHDLRRVLGTDQVGLLTGDNAINGDAPVVVMTTEVLRNMIYARAVGLDRLGLVILDEIHYLEDTWRGPVWEEVIIHLPASVRIIGLSATVSNADELADWISTARGPTRCVVEHRRPVELSFLYCIGDRRAATPHLIPLLTADKPNREGYRFDVETRRGRSGGRRRRPFHPPRRLDVIDLLDDRDLLPAIFFIFSRAGCDDAVQRCLDRGVRFTNREQRAEIDQILEDRVHHIGPGDRAILGYERVSNGLRAGVAAHHAGLVPAFKEAVEQCFVAGLIKVVFATETLALGINMPARSVVIDKLSKFTGETHEMLTPGQFTQLTGRAGRRGLDTLGTATVLWSPYVSFDEVAAFASSRRFELRSAFRPTYNMAANLVRRYDEEAAHHLLARSFAQFQTERRLAELDAEGRKLTQQRDQLRQSLGDDLVAAKEPTTDQVEAPDLADALSALKPGEVLVGLPDIGRCVVLSVAFRRRGLVRLAVVDDAGRAARFDHVELLDAPTVIGSVELPRPYNPSQRAFQEETAARLQRAGIKSSRSDSSSAAPRRDHDVAARLDRHDRLDREIMRIEARRGRQGRSLDEQFRAVLTILAAHEHVDGWFLTIAGQRLASIYHERDLLVSLALGAGLFDDLDPARLAGLASCLTYEHRSPDPPPDPWFPDNDTRRRHRELDQLARDLNDLEDHHGLTRTTRPDPTLFALVHAWTAGQDLEDLLDLEFLSGGDFVRNMKQLVDLLRQFPRLEMEPGTSRAAVAAAKSLHRGVVASSGLVTRDDLEGEPAP